METAAEQRVRTVTVAWVSPITAWEVGLLVARQRLPLSAPPKVWFDRLVSAGYRIAPLDADVLIAASYLPGELHRDPADRILVATARRLDCPLVTRDRRLLDYASAGWMQALAC